MFSFSLVFLPLLRLIFFAILFYFHCWLPDMILYFSACFRIYDSDHYEFYLVGCYIFYFHIIDISEIFFKDTIIWFDHTLSLKKLSGICYTELGGEMQCDILIHNYQIITKLGQLEYTVFQNFIICGGPLKTVSQLFSSIYYIITNHSHFTVQVEYHNSFLLFHHN